MKWKTLLLGKHKKWKEDCSLFVGWKCRTCRSLRMFSFKSALYCYYSKKYASICCRKCKGKFYKLFSLTAILVFSTKVKLVERKPVLMLKYLANIGILLIRKHAVGLPMTQVKSPKSPILVRLFETGFGFQAVHVFIAFVKLKVSF